MECGAEKLGEVGEGGDGGGAVFRGDGARWALEAADGVAGVGWVLGEVWLRETHGVKRSTIEGVNLRVFSSPVVLLAGLLATAGCRREKTLAMVTVLVDQDWRPKGEAPVHAEYVGFDRNLYPGDERLAELHKHFAFVGYWLNNPPGETENSWVGKRGVVRAAGFGFLVLWNGRLDKEIQAAGKKGTGADALGMADAARAVAAARREGFPAGAVLFLDQEEGGRLLPEQAAYFFGWTEAVAASGYRAGAYLSGQSTPDGTRADGRPMTITTAQDVREQVAARKLHPVALWVAEDTCPPAPGCTLASPKLGESGTAVASAAGDVLAWQYAQSPRRPALTKSCAKTYGADGLCYAGVSTDLFLDLDVAGSADPSGGR